MLRPATPDDAGALAAVLRTAMRDAMPELPELHTPDEDLWFLREVVLPHDEVWVSEVRGRPVGFVALEHATASTSSSTSTSNRSTRAAGSARSSWRMRRLWVFQGNARARRFYERHGLRLVELTDGSGNEEHEPDALYEWLP